MFALVLAALTAVALQAAAQFSYDSQQSGNWNDAATWAPVPPANGPQTGAGDTVTIHPGHIVIATPASVGLPGSADLGAAANGHIILNGGVLSQTAVGNWVRIGHVTNGSLTINAGRYHFVDTIGTGGPNLQVGIRGATGFVTVGDGTGAPGSALLDLRHNVAGAITGVNPNFNLGATEGGQPNGTAGHVVVNSDGLIEGAGGITRIGQGASATQSTFIINAGGRFNARANIELGSTTGADGLLRITGTDALLNKLAGSLLVANGAGSAGTLEVLNGGRITSTTGDIVIGQSGNGTAIFSGAGTEVTMAQNDFRVGRNNGSTGHLTVTDGARIIRNTGNFTQIGEQAGSNGTVILSNGASWEEQGSGHQFHIGRHVDGMLQAQGSVTLTGGSTLDLAGQLFVAQNGVGTLSATDSTIVVNNNLRVGDTGISDGTLNLTGSTLTYISGSGDTVIGHNVSATGRLSMDNSIFNSNRNFRVGSAADATGTVTLTNGSSLTVNDLRIGQSGTGVFSATNSTIIANNNTRVGQSDNGSGAFHLLNSSFTYTSAAGEFIIGDGGSSTGLMTMDSASITTNRELRLGSGADAEGTLTAINGSVITRNAGNLRIGLNGSGTLTLTNSSLVQTSTSGDSHIGSNADSTGIWNATGSTITLLNSLRVGNSGDGTFNLVNSTLNYINTSSGNTYVGANNGSTGLMTLDNSHFNTVREFRVGQAGGSTGTFHMNAGSSITLGSLVDPTNAHLRVGDSGNGTFNQTGGAITFQSSSGNTIIGTNNGSIGVYNMTGGSFATNREIVLGENNGSEGTWTISNATVTQAAPPSGSSDIRIGRRGEGTMIIGDGGLVTRGHTNWSWVGHEGTGDGTLHILGGGAWNSTNGSAQLRIGNNEDSTGLVVVHAGGALTNAGSIELSNAGGNATLIVNGTLLSNNTVLVGTTGAAGGAGSALLSGAGSIGSALQNTNVNIGPRGTLMPGNSPGNLDLFGSLTMQAGSRWALSFDGADSGKLTLTGSFIGALNNITLVAGDAFDPTPNVPLWALNNQGPTAFNPADLFANASATPPPGTSLYPDATGWVSLGGQSIAFYTGANFNSGALFGGNDIAFFVTPEPGRAMLLTLALLTLVCRHRIR